MGQAASIRDRDKGKCWICTRGVALEDASRDHLKPRSEGGYDRARNYRNAHKRCNTVRGRLPEGDVDRIRNAMWPCSTEALLQAIGNANKEYMRSPVAQERLAPTPRDPWTRLRIAKADMKSNRRAAKARRRAEWVGRRAR